jgi:hypothetical protein
MNRVERFRALIDFQPVAVPSPFQTAKARLKLDTIQVRRSFLWKLH